MARLIIHRMDEALACWRRSVNFRKPGAAKASARRFQDLGAAIIKGHDGQTLRATLEAEGVGAHRAFVIATNFITALHGPDNKAKYEAGKLAACEVALAIDFLGETPGPSGPQGRTPARADARNRGAGRPEGQENPHQPRKDIFG